MNRRMPRVRIAWVSALVACAPLIGAGVIAGVGHCGPTLLYQDDHERPWWYGIGKLPAVTWASMQQPGQYLMGNEFRDFFFGAVTGEHGDVMVACGPEGVAIARCVAPGSRYGGRLQAWRVFSHTQVLALSSVISLALFLTVFIIFRAITPFLCRLMTPPGHCRCCGYNLTGNVSRVCPECGSAIAFEGRMG